MKRNCYRIVGMVAVMMLMLTGCGDNGEETATRQEQKTVTQGTEEELEEMFIAAEDDVITVMEQYAESTEYPKLAEFLATYYQIPEEELSETRYYYNYVDLNDDGTNEIFAVVIGDYTEIASGNPALILWEENDTFGVVESFEGIHTPVMISDQITNGWHDIIYQQYGGGTEDGYRVCRYNPEGGYQTELTEVIDELESVGGIRILSNNLIDDLDRGVYLTLAPQEENTTTN